MVTDAANLAAAANALSAEIAAAYTPVAADTPTFIPTPGTYTDTQSVTITSNAPLFYTTDGSTPTTASTPYTGPVSVAASKTVKAVASGGGLAASPIGSAAYVINVPSGWTPAQLFPGTDGAWVTAYDQSQMTVNADGSGGAPSVGAVIGRLTDRSGNGYHLNITNGTVQKPIVQSGYLGFNNVPGTTRPSLSSANNAFAGNTHNFTMLWYADVYGIPDGTTFASLDHASGVNFELTGGNNANNGNFRILSNSAFIDTGLKYQTRRCVIVCRGTPSEFRLYVNGHVYVGPALTSLTLRDLNVIGGASTKLRLYEWLVLKTAVSDAVLAQIVAYGATQAGYGANNSDVLLALGDSLTGGVGSLTCQPWIARTGQMPTALQYCYAREGQLTASSESVVATMSASYKGFGRNIVVPWWGTNDLITAYRTPAQIDAALNTYHTALRAAGIKTVAVTLQDIGGFSSGVTTLNGIMRTNAPGYSNAIADLGADVRLQDHTNLTYFNPDGVHLTDAGHAVVELIISAAIASIP